MPFEKDNASGETLASEGGPDSGGGLMLIRLIAFPSFIKDTLIHERRRNINIAGVRKTTSLKQHVVGEWICR